MSHQEGEEARKPGGGRTRTYVVQPADTLQSVAAELFGGSVEALAKANPGVGNALRPGQVLVLADTAASESRTVSKITGGPVVHVKPESRHGEEVEPGDPVWIVSTSDGRGALITLDDGTTHQMSGDEMLVLHAPSKGGGVERRKTQVLVREGSVKGGLASLDAGSKSDKSDRSEP